MSKIARDRISAKIRALLAKTVENGATEAEAAAALSKAEELLNEHDLAYDDVRKEVQAEVYGARSKPRGKVTRRGVTWSEVSWCGKAVGDLYHCRSWKNVSSNIEGSSTASIVYFGSESDTALAHQTLDLIEVALATSLEAYAAVTGQPVRAVRRSFAAGFTSRINQRIAELIAARQPPQEATSGRALVIAEKAAAVNERFDAYKEEGNLRIGPGKATRINIRSRDAHEAGRAAGDRVNIAAGPAVSRH